jgi:hypothetical protein
MHASRMDALLLDNLLIPEEKWHWLLMDRVP